MIKKDNYITGFVVSVITPVLTYLLLLGTDALFQSVFEKSFVRAPHYLYLLAVVPNFFWIRYYFSKLKFSKSGAAVLLVTIVYVLLYFFNYFQPPQ